jgi:two-component system, NarL family, sensor histidine kinase DevS
MDAESVADRPDLRLLLDAVVALAGDLALDSVLDRIVTAAAALVGARYVALGVLGPGKDRRLQAFITYGLTSEQRAQIGDLPHGKGLLGLVIDRPEPIRLHDIAEHPESFGFPANHPPMRSFLGVPVRTRGTVFGNLYLTEKLGGGDFTTQDEAVVIALAGAAGVVIENARLYEDSARRQRWLEATTEIASLLLGRANEHDALQAVADRARDLARADFASVVVRRSQGKLAIHVVSRPPGDAVRPPALPLDGPLAGAVISSGQTVVVEDLAADPRVDQQALCQQGWPELGAAVLVPLRTVEGIEGVLTLAWSPANDVRFHEVDVALPQSFAEQAALSLQVARSQVDKERLAVFEDRDRIALDLHDLVIQRLFAVGLSLENTGRMATQTDVTRRVGTAVDDIDDTIKEIRRSIFALSNAEELPHIREAVGGVVARSTRSLPFQPAVRFDGPVNAAIGSRLRPHVLAVLEEALSNVVRHAGASAVEVTLVADDAVTLTITDNGTGFGPGVARSGLRNMEERAMALGGTFVAQSDGAAGTTVRWQVPTL